MGLRLENRRDESHMPIALYSAAQTTGGGYEKHVEKVEKNTFSETVRAGISTLRFIFHVRFSTSVASGIISHFGFEKA